MRSCTFEWEIQNRKIAVNGDKKIKVCISVRNIYFQICFKFCNSEAEALEIHDNL